MEQGSGPILTSPVRRPARRTGVTFLEVVFSSVILAMAAAAITGAFSLIERLSMRDEARLDAYEVAHRLILQYMDDPDSLPPTHLPIEIGNRRFHYTAGAEALLQEPGASEAGVDRRESRNVAQLDSTEILRGRLLLITVRVDWERPDGFRDTVAVLSRVFDPFGDADSMQMLTHLRKAFENQPEMQMMIEQMIQTQRQKAEQERFERQLQGR